MQIESGIIYRKPQRRENVAHAYIWSWWMSQIGISHGQKKLAGLLYTRAHACNYVYIYIYLYLYLDLDPYSLIYLDLGFLKIWKLSLSYLLKVSCLLPIRHRLKVCKLFTFKEMQVMVMNIFPKHFLCKFTLFKQSCRFPLFTMSRLPSVRTNAGLVSKNLPVCIKIVIPVKYQYLVGMSRWENLFCIPESWFGSVPN